VKADGRWKMEDGTQLQLIMTDCHIKYIHIWGIKRKVPATVA